jgi:heme o synthase
VQPQATLEAPARGSLLSVLAASLELAKPRLSSLVILTVALGYVLGGSFSPAGGVIDWAQLFLTCLGATLGAFGANALNQWVECPWDQRMERTQGRPLPSGRLSSRQGLLVAGSYLAASQVILGVWVGVAPALIVLGTAVLYVALYTPLKQRSASCTLIGAVCGATPPVIGWVAATGRLDPAACVLFGILFLWQIPHFLAIDWIHRHDYARGGFRMLSSYDPSGGLTGRLTIQYCVALLAVSLLAIPAGLGGWLYALGALLLGLAFLGTGIVLHLRHTQQAARRVFLVSLAYLPALLLLLVLDPTRL